MPASYRFDFKPHIKKRDIEATIDQAERATKMLHGAAKFELDTDGLFAGDLKTIILDADTLVGRHLCLLFSGLLRERFALKDFDITRLTPKVRRELERQPR